MPISPFKKAYTIPSSAENIDITDTGAYFTGTTVEGALQETGAQLGQIAHPLLGSENLQTILDAGNLHISLNPAETYVMNGINIPTGAIIIGNGATITSTNTTAPVFDTNGNDDIEITGIRFVGSTALPDGVASVATDIGIEIDTSYRVSIRDCEFKNFLGCGVNAHGLPNDVAASLANKQIRHIYSGNRFSRCFIGLAIWDQAEYSVASDNTFTFCRVAIWSQAGNCSFTGNSIVMCRAAFVSTDDTNDIITSAGQNRQHGSVVGNVFNHCRSDQANIPWSANFLMNTVDYQGVWVDGANATYPPTYSANTQYYTDLAYYNANTSAIPVWIVTGCIFSTMTVSCSHDGYMKIVGCTEVTSVTKTKVLGSGFNAAMIRKTGNQGLNNYTDTILTWDEAIYGSYWTVGDSSKLVVPAGAKKVRVTAQIAFAASGVGTRRLDLVKNGVTSGQGRGANYIPPSPTDPTILSATMPCNEVVSGDYFQARAYQDSGGALNVLSATTSWFYMEVLE